jgi:hypothetical protein
MHLSKVLLKSHLATKQLVYKVTVRVQVFVQGYLQ